MEIVKVANPDLERMMEIALASLEAGEALPEVTLSRTMEAVPYKYGMHLGNWTDGGSGGLEREMEATLPGSALFMDNVKGQPLQLQLERLARKGVKPILIFRPYFDPRHGNAGAAVENYANGAVIRLRNEYLVHPLIQEAYEQGRMIIKLFNETNIGGEGFARGRAGFADALRCWKQARSIVKTALPTMKFMSIANTPGNDDVWFTGDVQNATYWYHGAEAAKANPTAVEIQAAIASCVFREMFQLCDVIGIHVYAQDERQTRGDLQTWYARRHEQALKFLAPYINAGKKMIISEWDCGYDQQPNPQQARAELCVHFLAVIVGPNDAILTTNHWWNSDDGEGAITWEKHQTRKGGELRPVVNAIKGFREGALPPVDPEDPDEPEEPEVPEGLPPRVLVDLPDFVSITEANVAPGEKFWRAVRVERRRGDANGGQRHIYHWQPHNGAVTMVVGVEDTPVVLRIPHDKPANEPAANHPMDGGGNRYWSRVEGLGIQKSDQINGMRMFQNQHESFHITWELVTMPTPETPQPSDWQSAMMDRLDAVQLEKGIRLNPNAGIQKIIFAQGFVPVVGEIPFTHPDKTLPATQKAERLTDSAKRYYTWSPTEGVRWYERGGSVLLDAPYYSQVEARWSANDCGAATMATKIHHRTGKAQNVDTLAREASEIQGEDGANYKALQLGTLETLGLVHGVPLIRATESTWERAQEALRGYLAQGKTVTLLIHYDALPLAVRREKVNGKVKGHYLEAVGYDTDGIVYHDPYHAGQGGKNLRMTWMELRKAWEMNSRDGNLAYSMRA